VLAVSVGKEEDFQYLNNFTGMGKRNLLFLKKNLTAFLLDDFDHTPEHYVC